MKWVFFFLTIFLIQNIKAQQTEGVKTISMDSLKKYHIGIAKDSDQIHVAKNWVPYSDKMSFWEKCKYFAKIIYDKYTVLSWLLMILVGFWLISVIAKIFGKL
jgi:hypothetical protein